MPPWWWFPVMAILTAVSVYCLVTMPWDEIEAEWRDTDTGRSQDEA